MSFKPDIINIICKRLNPQVEKILLEGRVGFRKGRSTVEQVFNCINLIDKHLNSQNNILHNFVDLRRQLIEYIMNHDS